MDESNQRPKLTKDEAFAIADRIRSEAVFKTNSDGWFHPTTVRILMVWAVEAGFTKAGGISGKEMYPGGDDTE